MMTYPAEQTAHKKQLLPLYDAPVPVPASNIKVYKNGKLIRIEDKDGAVIRKIKCG